MNGEGRPGGTETADQLAQADGSSVRQIPPVESIESRSVSWWPTHEFITALVAQANHLPVAGTPAWCALQEADPAKLLALAVAGEHHVLRMEIAQEEHAEASRAVSATVDWPAVAREIGQRSAFRAERPWARRVVE